MSTREVFRRVVPLRLRKGLKKFVKYNKETPVEENISEQTTEIENKKLKCKCIICDGEFENYIPAGSTEELFQKHHIVGGGVRKNCLCPKCGKMDRERFLYYVIKNKTKISELNGRILHFAPEETIVNYIGENKNIDYYTCDIELGRAMHIVDITDIQFKDETFDYLICNHVMEHIPDEAKAVSEIKRVLKKKGKWIFSFPICLDMTTQEDKNIKTPEERLKYYGQEDHVRLYGKDYLKRYEKYGLKIEVCTPKKYFNEEEIEKYGFIPDDIIMIATKK